LVLLLQTVVSVPKIMAVPPQNTSEWTGHEFTVVMYSMNSGVVICLLRGGCWHESLGVVQCQ